MKKYFKKNKVYFGDTDIEVRKLKKKGDYFYIYVDKDMAHYIAVDGEVRGEYHCFYAKEIEWEKRMELRELKEGFEEFSYTSESAAKVLKKIAERLRS